MNSEKRKVEGNSTSRRRISVVSVSHEDREISENEKEREKEAV